MARRQDPPRRRRPRQVGRVALCRTAAEFKAARAAGAAFLCTPPGAAEWLGVGYLRRIAGGDDAAIDVGDHAGLALAALREGWRRVVFTGRGPAKRRLADIAKQSGAVLLPRPRLAGEARRSVS
ncbi:MAG: hypothetical protein FJX47_03370 [Alphaproteobacteria bacterium]|nr:hypothetical protein [Alphaproteobacteria bacterium]